MPYFLYRISPERQLSLVTSFERFAEAKQAARAMRAASDVDTGHLLKIIFAQNPADAEQLLAARRERQPSEDD